MFKRTDIAWIRIGWIARMHHTHCQRTSRGREHQRNRMTYNAVAHGERERERSDRIVLSALALCVTLYTEWRGGNENDDLLSRTYTVVYSFSFCFQPPGPIRFPTGLGEILKKKMWYDTHTRCVSIVRKRHELRVIIRKHNKHFRQYNSKLYCHCYYTTL